MLNKYYVEVLSLNKSGGNSEELIRRDDYDSAESLFYDKCSNYAGNAQTGYVVIKLINPYGGVLLTATIDRIPKPEPEEPTV